MDVKTGKTRTRFLKLVEIDALEASLLSRRGIAAQIVEDALELPDKVFELIADFESLSLAVHDFVMYDLNLRTKPDWLVLADNLSKGNKK